MSEKIKVIVDRNSETREKVKVLGFEKTEKGLYYIDKDGDIALNGKRMLEVGITREEGYAYHLDRDGDITRWENKDYVCISCNETKKGSFGATICRPCFNPEEYTTHYKDIEEPGTRFI